MKPKIIEECEELLLGKYYVEELNRGERAIRDSEIKQSQNIEKMKSAGAARSADRYLSGMKKGNAELMKKHNIKPMGRLRRWLQGLTGYSKDEYYTAYGRINRPVYLDTPEKLSAHSKVSGEPIKKILDSDIIGTRHEIDEDRVANKLKKKRDNCSYYQF